MPLGVLEPIGANDSKSAEQTRTDNFRMYSCNCRFRLKVSKELDTYQILIKLPYATGPLAYAGDQNGSVVYDPPLTHEYRMVIYKGV